jgi:hypothetical protein
MVGKESGNDRASEKREIRLIWHMTAAVDSIIVLSLAPPSRANLQTHQVNEHVQVFWIAPPGWLVTP